MSLTKSSPAYARHMDEVMNEDTRDMDLEWREYCHITEAQRTTAEERRNLADKYPNVHDKAGTKEDIFGMLGRIFKP